jgi:hypothetical protein
MQKRLHCRCVGRWRDALPRAQMRSVRSHRLTTAANIAMFTAVGVVRHLRQPSKSNGC